MQKPCLPAVTGLAFRFVSISRERRCSLLFSNHSRVPFPSLLQCNPAKLFSLQSSGVIAALGRERHTHHPTSAERISFLFLLPPEKRWCPSNKGMGRCCHQTREKLLVWILALERICWVALAELTFQLLVGKDQIDTKSFRAVETACKAPSLHEVSRQLPLQLCQPGPFRVTQKGPAQRH